MPKSKRAKVVHLTQVDKKGKELSLKLFANVQECVDKYPYIYVFSVENMRNTYLKQVRAELSDSRLFFGKTKVMAKALGTTPESSYQTNTHLLAPHLTGNVGLLFTTSSPTLLTARLASLTSTDYARAGTPATRAFLIPAGTVYSTGGETSEDADVPLSHSLEPELRRLGVPTSLVKGRISLQNEYEVCKEGQTLDSRQTRLLKLFGVATAEFRVELVAVWEKEVEGVRVLGGEGMEE